MQEISELYKKSVDKSNYEDVEAVENDFCLEIKIAKKIRSGQKFLKTAYEVGSVGDQRLFFRNLAFLQHLDHPLISKLEGYSIPTSDSCTINSNENFIIYSEFPENGFFIDFFNLSRIDNTTKSQILYGVALIGSYLHSKNIIHRCFAPPSFGLDKDLNPILLTLTTARSNNGKILNDMIQPGYFNWIAPELDDNTSYDSKYNNGLDVFSFGCFIYYLFKHEVPFQDPNAFRIFEMKRNAEEYIRKELMDEDIKELIKRCWDKNISKRPTFDEILNLFKNHKHLFPGTDYSRFDKYIKNKQSFKVTSDLAFLIKYIDNDEDQLKKVTEYIKILFNSIKSNNEMQNNLEMLKDVYILREQTESYTPIFLECKRGGCMNAKYIKAPEFMFCSVLKNEIKKIFEISEDCQILEVNGGELISAPYLTLQDLNIENGTEILIYNNFSEKPIAGDSFQIDFDTYSMTKCFTSKLVPDETVEVLFHDINHFSRIPLDKFSVIINGNTYNYKNISKIRRTLHEAGLEPGFTVHVKSSISNDSFQITVDLDLIFDTESSTKTITVSPLTKISKMMDELKIDKSKSLAILANKDGKEIQLSQTKALIDYKINEKSTIKIKTSIL